MESKAKNKGLKTAKKGVKTPKKAVDNQKKKVFKEVTTSSVNTETGEVNQVVNVKESFVSREPDYIKLYIEDLTKLNDLPKSTNDLLYSLLKRMNYDNEIILVVHNKKRIAKELNLKLNTIDQNLMKLTDKGILSRVATGVYIANPYIFGRGKWEDIRELRMKITYTSKGRAIIGEVDRQTNFEFPEDK